MKIAFVLHSFPPRIVAGTEMSVLRLAKILAPEHQVRVIHAEYDLFEPEGKVINSSVSGIATTRIITHRLHKTPEETYSNRNLAEKLKEILFSFMPDIVHFHHFLENDVAIVDDLKEKGIAVLATLHDYWALCGRSGQMLKWDNTRCRRFDPIECADCLSRSPLPASKPLTHFMMSNIYKVKRVTPDAVRDVVRALRAPVNMFLENFIYKTQFSNPVPGEGPPCDIKDISPIENRWNPENAQKRYDYFLKRLKNIQLISPSHFLKKIYVENGYPADNISVIENGLPSDMTPLPRSNKKDKIRFGFIGTPAPVKGVLQIILASEKINARHSVHIFGDTSIHPRYGNELKKHASSNVIFHGSKMPGKAAGMFNQIDVLILPSIWWENAPVVLREARAFAKPSITSDLGGMSETIKDGVDGWLVKAGDIASLSAVMERLSNNPDEVEKMAMSVRPPIRIDDVIPEIINVYGKAKLNVAKSEY